MIRSNHGFFAATLLGVCGALTAPLALAQSVYRFNLPAQSMADTLRAIGRQTSLNILFDPSAVKGLSAAPIKGTFTATEAIDRALGRTRLVETQTDAHSVLVKPAADPTPTSAASASSLRLAAAKRSDSPPAPETTARRRLQEVVVTGSNIPVAAGETVPVTVISAENIAKSGTNANVLDILRKQMPQLMGKGSAGGNFGATFSQNTAGGSEIAIRGLDTLVLLNGHRVAASGANGFSTGRSFVDVSQFPAAAIERIEVLTDGASAIYGSDAVGGVVNIILKSDFHGIEVGGRDAEGTDGGYNERSAYLVAGFGGHRANFALTASWSKTPELLGSERPFDSPLLGQTAVLPGVIGADGHNPGAFLEPGLVSPSQMNPVGANATASTVDQLIANGTYAPATTTSIANSFDNSPYQTLLLGQEQKSLVGDFTAHLLDDRLVAFGDFELSDVTTTDLFRPSFTTLTVPAGAPYNPLTVAFPQVTFTDLSAPKPVEFDAVGRRVMAGLRGKISAHWNWQASVVYDENKIEQKQLDVIYGPNLTRAIAGGYDAQGNPLAGGGYSRVLTGFSESSTSFVLQPALDPFSRSPDLAALANVLGTEFLNTKSVLETAGLKVVGMPFALPAGRFAIALGADFRREALNSSADPNGYNTGSTNHRWVGGVYLDPFSRSRTVSAGYAEIRVPITGPQWSVPGLRRLAFSAAARDEHYSDAGNSLVPKFGLNWEPFDRQLTARFTYSKAFTAPTLFAMFGPTSTNLTAPSVLTQVFGIAGQVNQMAGNNPNLKPSSAWTRSLGLTIAPKAVPGLTVIADYTNTSTEGVPGGAGATNILSSVDQLGTASPFFHQFAFGAFPGQPGATPVTAPGQISSFLQAGGTPSDLHIVDYFVNLGGARIKATDLTVDYLRPTERFGTLEFSTTGDLLSSYEFQALPGQPFYEYAGYATFVGAGSQGTLPKYRFYTTAEWSRGPWDVFLGNTYIPGVTDIGGGGAIFATSKTLKPVPVSRYFAWDLHVSYTGHFQSRLQQVRLSVGVNNLFNRMPPQSSQAFTDANVDTGTYSPIGRLVYVTASARF